MVKFHVVVILFLCALFFAPFGAFAQCGIPSGFSIYPPLTSAAATLTWNAVPGAANYQIRFWESANPSDKTIVDNFGPPPFILRGLKKNTLYKAEIRSKCGSVLSNWSATIQFKTANSSGSCGLPTGVTASVSGNNVLVTWSSSGVYSIRYRQVANSDWFVPAGGLNITNGSFSINQLPPGNYEIEVKRNCSGTASLYTKLTVSIANLCATPSAPLVVPDVYQATIALPVQAGTTGYWVSHRNGFTGPWIDAGPIASGTQFVIISPLIPASTYQARIRAVCASGLSDYSSITTFNTLPEPVLSCLRDKNAGKNISSQELTDVKAHYNRPSPHTFGDMIGVNDGGLIFRSFQNVSNNQITQLTRHFRNFHTMDEDFDASLNGYQSNIKPKNTIPEGTPANMGYNKGLYQLYRNTHGFTGITAATELLQYAPQSWKDKIYKESDWSVTGAAGIRNAFKNYTNTFIQHFAPANGSAPQILAANFQVGNELWDYPVKSDYQHLLLGARDAFVLQYGPKSQGGWKMRLIAGAFQAYRDGNCNGFMRDISNCGGDLARHDFIGDYLDFEPTQCAVLQDLGAIDCHPYSFKDGTTQWTYPEDPSSETRQIASLASWLRANRDETTGILAQTTLWSSEFGFDSYWVGEKTQAAYLLRGLFLHSRYHFEKVYVYNAFDATYPNGPGYESLYGSSGLWRQGMQEQWPSPLEQNSATPKPAWFGLMDLKSRFGQHVFFGVLAENQQVMAILMARPDSTDPYVVFWSPRATTDADAGVDIPVSQLISWQQFLPAGFTASSGTAQLFAQSQAAGEWFDAASGMQCGLFNLQTVKRYPAFIQLIPCNGCQNITQPGSILSPNLNSGTAPFDPSSIENQVVASGGDVLQPIVYQWQHSIDHIAFVNIPGANAASFNPPALNQTTYYRRGARRAQCPNFVYTPTVQITVNPGNICPVISKFERKSYTMSNCNPQGDYYYEVHVNQINTDVSIELEQLPGNGINISMSLLNGTPFTSASFQSNVQFVDNQTLIWNIKASNGSNQVLRLYYCWTNVYPVVSQTSATNLCNQGIVYCSEGFSDPGSENRHKESLQNGVLALIPNPGSNQLTLTLSDSTEDQTRVMVYSATGHLMADVWMEVQSLALDTRAWPSGMYVVALWREGRQHQWVWIKA
jgi:hypothetical protein